MPCRIKQALRHSIAQPLDSQQPIGYSQQAQLERQRWWGRFAQALRARRPPGSDVTHLVVLGGRVSRHEVSSQRSLHNAPIFRLLLKVAVNGTHQCDFSNFCGAWSSNHCFFSLHGNSAYFRCQRCWLQFRALQTLKLSLAWSALVGQRLYLHRITSEVSPAFLIQHSCYTFYP